MKMFSDIHKKYVHEVFVTTKNWKHNKSFSVDKWISKWWSIHTTKILHNKNKELLLTEQWKDPRYIFPSWWSWTRRLAAGRHYLLWDSEKGWKCMRRILGAKWSLFLVHSLPPSQDANTQLFLPLCPLFLMTPVTRLKTHLNLLEELISRFSIVSTKTHSQGPHRHFWKTVV